MSGRRKTQRASVRVRRLVALSGLVAGSMFSGAHPAAAGPQPTELHHNISGAELGQGSYRKTDWVKWAFNSAGSGSSRPLAISLNETCYNQAAELESWIQASHGLDYTLLFYAQKSGVGKCPAINGQGAGKYGVGVLTLGQHDTRAGQFASQEQGDNRDPWVRVLPRWRIVSEVLVLQQGIRRRRLRRPSSRNTRPRSTTYRRLCPNCGLAICTGRQRRSRLTSRGSSPPRTIERPTFAVARRRPVGRSSTWAVRTRSGTTFSAVAARVQLNSLR